MTRATQLYADVVLTPANLHVLLFRERAGDDDVWIAQCLDYDIAAYGRTIREAQAQFEQTFIGEVVLALERGEVPLVGILPPPSKYRRLWEEAIELAKPIPMTASADLSRAIGENPNQVPRGEAVFRIAA